MLKNSPQQNGSAASQWAPRQEILNQTLMCFRDPPADSSANNHHQQVMKYLAQLEKHPEFNNYLALIFCSMKSEPEALRWKAGLKLRNNINNEYDNISPAVRELVKQQVLGTIGVEHLPLRNTAGAILSKLAEKSQLEGWGPTLQSLTQMLDSSNPHVLDGAFSCLAQICEDCTQALDDEKLGRPLNFMVPKFIKFCRHQTEAIRKHALTCLDMLIWGMPVAMQTNMDEFLKTVMFLASKDPAKTIRLSVCSILCALIQVRPEVLTPCLTDAIKFMLMASQESDPEIAMGGCGFWTQYCETKGTDLKILGQYLDKLVPSLLKCMQYSKEDLVALESEDNDGSKQDRPQDIAPRFHHAKHVAQTFEEDEEDWEGGEVEGQTEWNLRKCAAASLDTVANSFRGELLKTLLPNLQRSLNSSEWLIRECGILALGAVAEGCYDTVKVYLKDLIPFLRSSLMHEKPLVRSISCWTLSRYSQFIIEEHDKYLKPLLEDLLKRVNDQNKKVQEAACSAFATLEEQAGDRVIPYLQPILMGLMFAFNKYQAKNLLILYDAIGTLAEAAGEDLNQPDLVNILMPPLMSRWEKLKDDDRNIFPLLECLTAVAQALGPGFERYAPPVYNRCLDIVQSTLRQQQLAFHARSQGKDMDLPDKEFIVCALDLLGGLAEGLEDKMEGLVGAGERRILVLLYECMKDVEVDVRQSAFALLGDLAKSCIVHLRPHLDKFLPIVSKGLNPRFISVCNNASWAVGEIAVRMGGEMQKYMALLLNGLVPLINAPDLQQGGLLENAAITLGRLALVCPREVAPVLDKFATPWCVYLRALRENEEKEHAFKGLCAVVQLNPKGMCVGQALGWFCVAIASWRNPTQELLEKFKSLLNSFKSFPSANWSQIFAQLDPQLQAFLIKYYGASA